MPRRSTVGAFFAFRALSQALHVRDIQSVTRVLSALIRAFRTAPNELKA